jgi:hypothetical protein
MNSVRFAANANRPAMMHMVCLKMFMVILLIRDRIEFDSLYKILLLKNLNTYTQLRM